MSLTLDELLALAKAVKTTAGRNMCLEPQPELLDKLARGIIDLLGEAVDPRKFGYAIEGRDGASCVKAYLDGGCLSPAEARAYAAMLLRAADEADAAGRTK